MKVWFQLNRSRLDYGYDIWLFKDSVAGREGVARPIELVFDEMEDTFGPLPAPTFRASESDLRELVQSWQSNSRFQGSRALFDASEIRASLDATKFHLEDMRKLVFNK